MATALRALTGANGGDTGKDEMTLTVLGCGESITHFFLNASG